MTDIDTIWIGMTWPPSGYCNLTKYYLTALDAACEPYSFINYNAIAEIGSKSKSPVHLLRRNRPSLVFVNLPGPFYYKRFDFHGDIYRVGVILFETDRLPEDWCEQLTRMDEIWIPTRFNYETFSRSGVPRDKLRIVPYCVDIPSNLDKLQPLRVNGKATFAFLYVIAIYNRKDVGLLLRSFYRAFKGSKDVCLILKINKERIPLSKIAESVEPDYKFGEPSLPKVIVIADPLPMEDMWRLYKACDVYATTERAKGWDYPAMEAMSCGKPVLSIDWSGSTEFLSSDNAFLIQPTGRMVYVPPSEDSCRALVDHRWPDVSEDDVVRALLYAYRSSELATIGKKGRELVRSKYSPGTVALKLRDIIHVYKKRLSCSSAGNGSSIQVIPSSLTVKKQQPLNLTNLFKEKMTGLKNIYSSAVLFPCGAKTREVIGHLLASNYGEYPKIVAVYDEFIKERPDWLPSSIEFRRGLPINPNADVVMICAEQYSFFFHEKLRAISTGTPILNLSDHNRSFDLPQNIRIDLQQTFLNILHDKDILPPILHERFIPLASDSVFMAECRLEVFDNCSKGFSGNSLSRLGLLFFLAGRFHEAYDSFQKDNNLIRGDWRWRNIHAASCLEVYGIHPALELIRKLYDSDINARNGYTSLAARLMDNHMDSLAMFCFKRDIDLNRMDANGKMLYAELLWLLNMREEAKALLKEALPHTFEYYDCQILHRSSICHYRYAEMLNALNYCGSSDNPEAFLVYMQNRAAELEKSGEHDLAKQIIENVRWRRDNLAQDFFRTIFPKPEKLFNKTRLPFLILEKLKALKATHKGKIILYGAGKHTKWLEEMLAKNNGIPAITAILDDKPEGKPSAFGLTPTRADQFKPKHNDVIILSTDCFQKEMTARCRELYGEQISIIDLYYGLPDGPYCKE